MEYFENGKINVRREDQRFERGHVLKHLLVIDEKDLLQTLNDPLEPGRRHRIDVLALALVEKVTQRHDEPLENDQVEFSRRNIRVQMHRALGVNGLTSAARVRSLNVRRRCRTSRAV